MRNSSMISDHKYLDSYELQDQAEGRRWDNGFRSIRRLLLFLSSSLWCRLWSWWWLWWWSSWQYHHHEGDQVHHTGRRAQGELWEQSLQRSEASKQISGNHKLKASKTSQSLPPIPIPPIIIISESGNAHNNSHERNRLIWLCRPWLDQKPCGANCPLF